MLKDVIDYIVKGLVEKSDAVSVHETQEADIYSLIIKTDNADVGKVIGKDGKTIRALRTIVNFFGPEGKEKRVDVQQ